MFKRFLAVLIAIALPTLVQAQVDITPAPYIDSSGNSSGNINLNGFNLILGDGSATDDAIVFGDSSDAQIYWAGAGNQLVLDVDGALGLDILFLFSQNNTAEFVIDSIGGTDFRFVSGTSYAAGLSSVAFEINYAAPIMLGSDTNAVIDIDVTNAAHTGTPNVLTVLDISSITGDPDATETAILIGAGWDADIDGGASLDLTGTDITLTTDQLDILSPSNIPSIGLQDDVFFAIGDVTDASSEAWSAYITMQLNSAGANGVGNVEIGGQVGASSPAATFVAQGDTLIDNAGAFRFLDQAPAMTGSNSQVGILIDSSTGNATGSGNTYTALNFNAHAVDAEKISTAILIEPTWNYGLSILADGSATANNITLGADQAADAQIYFDGNNLVFDVNATGAQDFLFELASIGSQFMARDVGSGNNFKFVAINQSNTGVDFTTIGVLAAVGTNESDIINLLKIDWDETDWSTATETLNAINIEGITQDVTPGTDTYNAINIGDAWDNYFKIDMTNSIRLFEVTGAAARDFYLDYDGNEVDFELNFTGLDFRVHDTANSTQFIIETAVSAGSVIELIRTLAISDIALDLSLTAAIMNGSDTETGLLIQILNADHTGSSNTLNALDIIGISGDPDATETAIHIGDGWDQSLWIEADGAATFNNITLGESATEDAQIYFDGQTLVFDMDGGSFNIVDFDMPANGYFDVKMVSTGNYVRFDVYNILNSGFNFQEINVASIAATDGSDIVNLLFLDWDETDWATATETLNALNIDGITQDAQGTYNAINIGTGWDSGIHFNDITAVISFLENTGNLSLQTNNGGIIFELDSVVTANPFVATVGHSLGRGNSAFSINLAAQGLVVWQAGDDGAILDLDAFSEATTDHTGGTLAGLRIGTITSPDAQMVHSAINLGEGWDYDVLFDGATTNLVFQEGGDFFIHTPGNAVIFDLNSNASQVALTLTQNNNIARGADVFSIEFVTMAVWQAGDIAAIIDIDGWDEASVDHTGGAFAGIRLGDIANPDVNMIHSGIIIGAGRDYAIEIDGDSTYDIDFSQRGTGNDPALITFGPQTSLSLRDYASAELNFLLNSSGGSTPFSFNGTNWAAAVGGFVNLQPVLQAATSFYEIININMVTTTFVGDGDDGIIGIDFDYNLLGNSTGTGNYLTGIQLGISGGADVDVTETAIEIEAGWDYGLSIFGDGSATTNNITLGESQTADAQIYFTGTNLTIDLDGTSTNDLMIVLGQNPGANFFVGAQNELQLNAVNAAQAGFNFITIDVDAIAATDGSDVVNMLFLNWDETDWATATETLNAISIDAITQDAQGTYNAINIGTGWDVGILNSARYVDVVQAEVGADGGGRVTVTITPATGYVELDCQDADTGCAIALSETGAVEGQLLTIVIIGLTFGDVTVPDDAGVLNGSAPTLNTVDDSVSFRYTGAIWTMTSVQDN